MADYDLLELGDKIKLRSFSASASVNAWNTGSIVEIIGFLPDGRLLVAHESSRITSLLSHKLSFPEGIYLVSRANIDEVIRVGKEAITYDKAI